MCGILKLKNSFDTNTVFGDAELLAFKTFYEDRKKLIKTMFRIQTKSKEFRLRQCITTISGILKSWSGFSLIVISSQNTKSRNEPNKDYKCQLTCQGILAEYIKHIMTPREKDIKQPFVLLPESESDSDDSD